MLDNDDEFLNELRSEFLQEAQDLLEQNESSFLELEKSHDSDALEKIFRLAHNLKGTAMAVSFEDLSTFAHEIENLLVDIRNETVEISSSVIDLLLTCNDQLKSNITDLIDDYNSELKNDELIEKLKRFSTLDINNSEKSITNDTSSIPFEETKVVQNDSPSEFSDAALESLRELGIEMDEPEVIQEINNTSIVATNVSKAQNKEIKKKAKDEFIKLSLTKVDNLLNHFGEQVILQSVLEHAKLDIINNEDLIQKTITQLSKITYDLQQTTIALRMVPIRNVFSKMERIIRDTGKSLGKKIDFIKHGESSELDKIIVEAIVDPLTHMVRNSVDHGIETSEERIISGKNEVGTIELRAYPKGGFFHIELLDDGKGLDSDKIREKAIAKNLIDKNSQIEESDLFQLIFQSGFSTHDVATDLSGRGVGMDVVKRTIEDLKGTVEITSKKGVGTGFSIRLPLSLAIFNGMVTKVGNENFIFSNSDIDEALRVETSQIRTIDSSNKILNVGDEIYPLIDLQQILAGRARRKTQLEENDYLSNTRKIAFITKYENKKYAILVDEILSQQRVVHKDLGPEASAHKSVSGGTILGDGKVCLIMECSKIIEQYKDVG